MIVFLADLVNGDDVRVVEVGNRFGLVPEAAEIIRARQRSGPDQLDGHQAIELFLTCSIDDTHATPGNLLEKLIFAQVAGKSS